VVSACLVTRGNVDLAPIINNLPFEDIVVWDNSKLTDLKVFGRYGAILGARHDLIYVQDDDAICPATEIVGAYRGDGLLVNVPPGEHPFVGWGAVFPRRLPFVCFDRYLAQYPCDNLFLRWPDVLFAHSAGWERVDFGHEDLPWATAEDRMYRQPEHYGEQRLMRGRACCLS
jgi:hypothetical protein